MLDTLSGSSVLLLAESLEFFERVDELDSQRCILELPSDLLSNLPSELDELDPASDLRSEMVSTVEAE